MQMENKMRSNTTLPIRHLLGIEGLSKEDILTYLDTADQFVEVNERSVKKVPTLRGKTIINLFLEPSTRTRVSFEIAAKRMSADSVNVSGKDSSVNKGETLRDTVQTLQAMNPALVVMRHPSSGAASFVARHLQSCGVINAGDGLHEHPTQALLDALTIRQHFGALTGLTVTMVGDAFRSRVARSNIFLHKILGNTIRVVAPPTLAVREFEALGVEVFHHMEAALPGSDVVMSLRMKHEYLKDYFVPNLEEYSARYYIDEKLLSKYCPGCIVLAPGPFIRGVEIDTPVIDGPRSLYAKQVSNGVAVRMAVMYLLACGGSGDGLQENE